MNPHVERLGPPALVFGIALYLGWTPTAPLDLGDDIVRAKSVRWKGTDLDSPNPVELSPRDPFEPVLVKEQTKTDSTSQAEVASEVGETVEAPVIGLTEQALSMGLKVSGIAVTDQHRWAIVNGRAVSAGDSVPIIGQREKKALIQNVLSDVVIATADGLTVRLGKTRRSERPSRGMERPKDGARSENLDVAPGSAASGPSAAEFGGISLPPMPDGLGTRSPIDTPVSGKR